MNTPSWTNRGFTAPFTTRGRAALVPPPPWHYAGWLINVGFRFAATSAAPLVPPAAGRATGVGCVHFADWQATTDGSELLDPILSQYRETIVVLEINRPDGSRAMYCPAIWVDQDISLLRGLLQGWPKKLGSTWMTRSLPLDHPAAAPLRAGSALGASLAVKDRRLIEARLQLTGDVGPALGFLSAPTIGAVGWADLRAPDVCPEPRLLRPDIRQRTMGELHGATAELCFLEHPGEEIGELAGVAATEASVGWAGITVAGALDA